MFIRFTLFITVLWLSACGTPPVKEIESRQLQQAKLEQLSQFKVTGGLGVWTESESISTRIDWRQNAADFNVLITLPVGLSSARVIKKANGASVQVGDATPTTGASVGELLQDALGLGVAVPMEQIALWIRGVPGEDAQSVKFDEQGRLLSMNYRDSLGTLWQAKVLKNTQFKELQVPALIVVTGGSYNVRLVLKQWDELPDSDVTLESKPMQEAKPVKNVPGRLKVPGR